MILRAAFRKDLNSILSNNRSISMRYSSGSVIDDGWNDVSKSFSDSANLAIDGVEVNSYRWFTSKNLNHSKVSDGTNIETDNKNQSISTKTISFSGLIKYSFNSYININKNNLNINISSKDNSYYTGIKPVNIESDNFSFSIEYAIVNGKEVILVVDNIKNSTIGVINYNWNNKKFNLDFEIDKQSNRIYIYIDDIVKFNDFYKFKKISESVKIKSIFRSFGYYSGSYNFKISRIEYITRDVEVYENSEDYLNIASNYIEFKFKDQTKNDGYSYFEENNELFFVADKRKTLIESKSDDSSISIYKDSFGYLNFEIVDKEKLYKISYDAKNIKEKELNHISVGWSINETSNMMSMYINGEEVPNVYSVGTDIPMFSYEKFGDVSKEKLQEDFFSLIKFYPNMDRRN